MKANLWFLGAALLLVIPMKAEAKKKHPLSQGPTITIIYPKEGQEIPPVARSFVLGSVLPRARLTVNGQKVRVWPNGAFVAMIPYQSGDFTITSTAAGKGGRGTAARKVHVAEVPVTSPRDSLLIEARHCVPGDTVELLPGDLLDLSCKGTPGCRAEAKLDSLGQTVSMVEEPGEVGGIYQAGYIIQPKDSLKHTTVTFALTNFQGKAVTAKAPGKVFVLDPRAVRVAETAEDNVKLRYSPSGVFQTTMPPGIRFQVTGRVGEEYKAKLSGSQSVWLLRRQLRMLPPGTPVPKGKISNVQVKDEERWVRVLMPGVFGLPFKTEHIQESSLLRLYLYGASVDTYAIRQPSDTSMVRRISWKQKEANVCEIEAQLAPGQLWGYDESYNDSGLVFSLRKPPHIPERGSPFRGITICLDPGHSADPGAVGCLGTMEKDINWKIAQRLLALLEQAGAKVVLTREKDEDVPLYERPKRAFASGCDLFLGIHNNAVPDGTDPSKAKGFGVYYFTPQSESLARFIHQAYRKYVRISDDGVIQQNLAVCRPPQYPAVLTESAYIINPREEALLRTARFQARCAKAMFEGLNSFLLSQREHGSLR
jgi:N-acetylmuramoyl-L-alanine amidase